MPKCSHLNVRTYEFRSDGSVLRMCPDCSAWKAERARILAGSSVNYNTKHKWDYRLRSALLRDAEPQELTSDGWTVSGWLQAVSEEPQTEMPQDDEGQDDDDEVEQYEAA